MVDWPDPPNVPNAQRASGEIHLRYEDVDQEGCLTLHALPQAIGQVFWRKLSRAAGVDERLREQGIVPILTRLVTCRGEGPLSVFCPLRGHARFRLSSGCDAEGNVERVLLDVWAELEGPRGRVHGPPPPGAGEPVAAGRVFAEHTFTRPFAPPGERKVRGLEGLAPVPRACSPAESLLALPAGARALDELSFDDQPIAVGVEHTDANMHVNSLVHPRWIREAALRRLAKHGCDTAVAPCFQETAYRKPVFAGDTMRLALAAFELGDALGAVAVLLDDAPALAPERGRAYGLVLFRR